MRKVPDIPIALGCMLLMGLLMALAIIAETSAQRLDRDSTYIKSDSVPGIIDAHTMRSRFSEGFGSMMEALAAPNAEKRDAYLKMMTRADQDALAAREAYPSTIHIDPVRDSSLWRSVLDASSRYLDACDRMLADLRAGDRPGAERILDAEVRSDYRALLEACDALNVFNDSAGETYSHAILDEAAGLRRTVIAVLILAVLAGAAVLRTLLHQQKTRRALVASESKFEKAFEVIDSSIVISRRSDGRIIAANEASKRRYDLVGREIVGKTSVEVGIWNSMEAREALMRKLDADGHIRNYLKEHELPDGRKKTMLLSSEALQLDGEACIITVGQDITELVEAEQARARGVEEFRAIIDSSVIGMVLSRPDGRLVRCNPALQRFLGYSQAELSSMAIADFTHPDDVKKDANLFRRLIAGELNSYQMEKRFIRQDREVVWGQLTTSVVRRGGGELLYVIGMIEDVSERKQAELALRESEEAREGLQRQLVVAQKLEALGLLAGGVAHDFNNMLAAMVLYLDLLKADPALTSEMAESVAQVSQAAHRAAGLTRQLLLFSRREPVQRRLVDLGSIVEDLLKMLRRLLGSHFELTESGEAGPHWVQGDPGMLEQVLMNLVVNARDAMPQGGPIEVRLETVQVAPHTASAATGRHAGRFVCLSVRDLGVGMNREVQARIFEPFFTTKEAGKGTGLGLSTVFGIVQQHGGWVEVESAEGKGSTFQVFIPSHGGATDEGLSLPVQATSGRGRETILIAEDSEPVRRVTAKILRQSGYTVHEAADGNAAREILEREGAAIDLLLTDVVMPGGLMGHELAADLRDRRRPHKVILMSGYNTQIDRKTLESIGSRYLSKPFDTELLLRTVRAVLDNPAS